MSLFLAPPTAHPDTDRARLEADRRDLEIEITRKWLQYLESQKDFEIEIAKIYPSEISRYEEAYLQTGAEFPDLLELVQSSKLEWYGLVGKQKSLQEEINQLPKKLGRPPLHRQES